MNQQHAKATHDINLINYCISQLLTGRVIESSKKCQKHRQFVLKLWLYLFCSGCLIEGFYTNPKPSHLWHLHRDFADSPATRSRGNRSISRSRTRHRPRVPWRCKNRPELHGGRGRLISDWVDGMDMIIITKNIPYEIYIYINGIWSWDGYDISTDIPYEMDMI